MIRGRLETRYRSNRTALHAHTVGIEHQHATSSAIASVLLLTRISVSVAWLKLVFGGVNFVSQRGCKSVRSSAFWRVSWCGQSTFWWRAHRQAILVLLGYCMSRDPRCAMATSTNCKTLSASAVVRWRPEVIRTIVVVVVAWSGLIRRSTSSMTEPVGKLSSYLTSQSSFICPKTTA